MNERLKEKSNLDNAELILLNKLLNNSLSYINGIHPNNEYPSSDIIIRNPNIRHKNEYKCWIQSQYPMDNQLKGCDNFKLLYF